MCNQTGLSVYDGYGTINLSLWGSRWFKGLGNDAKIMFIYLIAGPETQASGLFPVDRVSMNNVPGIGWERVLLGDLKGPVEYSDGLFWVHGMYEAIKDADILREAQEQVSKLPDSPLKARFVVKHNIGPVTGNLSTGDILGAVSLVIGRDILQLAPSAQQEISRLTMAGYTAENIMELYGQPDGRWYSEDWRGQKGQRPTLSTINETIGPMITDGPKKVKANNDRVIEVVNNLQRGGVSAKEAGARISSLFGGDMWTSMKALAPWSTWRSWDTDKTMWAIRNMK